MALDLIKPVLLINRNEGPEGIELYSLSTNETMDGPNFPHDYLCLYSNGKWGLVGKYEPAEEFGQDERCTVILVSLEEARGKVTFVYGFDEDEQLIIPRRVCTGFFKGNPSGDDYQIFLLERTTDMEGECKLWISETQNPLGDGDVVNEDHPVVFNQNNGGLLWTRHRIEIQEELVSAFSLVFWNNSVFWINEEGMVHGFNLGSAVRTRYHLHPNVEFVDNNQGIGPCAYLAIEYGRLLYICTNADQVWICRLSNLGNQIGLIEPIPHENRIAGNVLFVNRGQAALLMDIEDLNMDLEDKILQGPLPNDCQIFNFETDQWHVKKFCSRTLCEGFWFLSEVEDLGQEHLHYIYVANHLEHGGGAAPPAAAIAEDEEEEEEEDVPVVIDKLSTLLRRTAVAVEVSGAQEFGIDKEKKMKEVGCIGLGPDKEVVNYQEDKLTTQCFSSAQAAAAPPLVGLTPEALEALGEEGGEVLVYSGSGSLRMLFHGPKALEGNNSAMPLPAGTASSHNSSYAVPFGEVVLITPAAPQVESDDTDIFADVDPDYHMLIVQQGQSTMHFRRPTEAVVQVIKVVISRCLRTNGIFADAFSMTNRKRKQQVLEKEGGSCQKPNVKLPSTINVPETVLQNNSSSLIVIKKVTGSIKLRPSSNRCPKPTPSFEQLMKLAREKDEGCALGVVFVEWKLSAPVLSALTLVPSLHSHLPWFYMVNAGPSQDNHLFGNMTTRQSFLVANSDLQSSSNLLYSKDGWLLLRGRERDFSYVGGFPRYPVFLLNPSTGARMDLPGSCCLSGFAAFCTTTQGSPEVVIYVHCRGNIVRADMIRPGDAYWEEHPYVFRHGQIGDIFRMVLCGGSVYCFFTLHTLIFKLADLSWKLVTGGSLKRRFALFEPLEVEGKVVVVGNPHRFPRALLGLASIPFFRMEISGDTFDWVEITGSDAELDGRIWFLYCRQSFCVKVAGSGHKICWFEGKGLSELGRGGTYAVHCLNVQTRAHLRLTADSVICSRPGWVDLGFTSDPGLLDHGISGDDLLPRF